MDIGWSNPHLNMENIPNGKEFGLQQPLFSDEGGVGGMKLGEKGNGKS